MLDKQMVTEDAKYTELMQKLRCKKKEAEDLSGYHIFLMILKGSQNYGCDDENSDIDAVAFFIPSLEKLIEGEMVSKKLTMSDGAFVELKDIRLFTDLMAKANPSYLELLYSPYQITDSAGSPVTGCFFEALLSLRDKIATMNLEKLYKCIKGTSYQMYTMLKKSVENDIEYNSKTLYQIYRMYLLTELTIKQGYSFKDALCPGKINACYMENILEYKKISLSPAECLMEAELLVQETERLVDAHLEAHDYNFDSSAYKVMQLMISEIIRASVVEDILGISNNSGKE